jgi:ABC-type sugar transport system ATPase subunit
VVSQRYMSVEICKIENISKIYPGVRALDDVSMEIRKGEIHGIIGKNGAGKSTLVNILAGSTSFTSGKITINGEEIPQNYNPYIAEKFSLFLVPQNPSILPERSILENLFSGYLIKNKHRFIDKKKMYEKASEIIDKFNLNLNPDQEMGLLPIDTQKLLLFGKAAYITNANIFMLDEITASLSAAERILIEKVLEDLKREKKSILFISHHLKEILQYCDRVTVLRDGRKVETTYIDEVSEETLASMIVGKDVKEYKASEKHAIDSQKTPILEVVDFKVSADGPENSFILDPNEVLGIAGIEGCGKDELFGFLSGSKKGSSGTILLAGQECSCENPFESINKGIVYLPRDREVESIFHGLSIKDNMMQLFIKQCKTKMGTLDFRSLNEKAQAYCRDLNIKIASLEDEIDSLSGGNKQKVIVSRVMSIGPKVLILNEPTQGVDIGAKQEILRIVREEMPDDAGIIISSESVQEMMAICDRIAVMYRGKIVKFYAREDFSEDEIYLSMQGSL